MWLIAILKLIYFKICSSLYFFFSAVLLYDKPASIFHPIEIEEKHEFLLKFSQDFDIVNNDIPLESVFTFINSEGKIEEKKDRPALLISSTSWTEDEDFEILLLALKGI